jgi:hypothetical protein
MHHELGFARYAAHGGDLGAGVTSRLAQARPAAVVGIHLLAIADPVEVDPSSVTQEEQDYLDSVAAWYGQDGAYAHQQMTPTHHPGLRPVGLPSWAAGLDGGEVPVLERLRR